MNDKIKIGIVGCGNISQIYFTNLTSLFRNTQVYACCDLVAERAQKKAAEFNVPHIMTLEEMLNDSEIKIIVNLTTPQGHYEICKKALLAGKNVYVEKPLSLETCRGDELVALAAEKGLLIGGAPDTFMGAGIQTARKLIDDGFIGKPIGATAFMMCHGHESWHPDPEFYYKKGGGPMFDMGPYYLTALVNLLGGVSQVCAMTSMPFKTRTVTSEKKFGDIIDVEVPTSVYGIMKFANGALGTIITSFDVWGSELPRIEIYGTEGSLSVPDPNCFGGEVKLKTQHADKFVSVPLTHNYSENSRGMGVSDMAECLLNGGNNIAGGKLADHVLEIMHAFHISGDSGNFYTMKTKAGKPQALSASLIKGCIR